MQQTLPQTKFAVSKQNSFPGKIVQLPRADVKAFYWESNYTHLKIMAKLFPREEFQLHRLEGKTLPQGRISILCRGLRAYDLFPSNNFHLLICLKQAAEIGHKEHNCSIGARRSSRSQNPDPFPIKNLELTPSKKQGEECLMGHFPPNSSSSLSS